MKLLGTHTGPARAGGAHPATPPDFETRRDVTGTDGPGRPSGYAHHVSRRRPGKRQAAEVPRPVLDVCRTPGGPPGRVRDVRVRGFRDPDTDGRLTG
jgi:hypothetical protein